MEYSTCRTGNLGILNYEFRGDYCHGAGEATLIRPDQISRLSSSTLPNNPSQYLNMASFAAPCTWDPNLNPGATDESNCVAGTRHFGSLGRNSLKGPSFKEFNFSVFKDTTLTEHMVLTLRAEFFQLTCSATIPTSPNPPCCRNFIGDAGAPDAATGRQANGYSMRSPQPATVGIDQQPVPYRWRQVLVACSSPRRSPFS